MVAPQQIVPSRLADYLEVMTKAIFLARMNWSVVEKKWPAVRSAFLEFDPEGVATFTPDDIYRLAADPAVIRNRRKIAATVSNAETMLALAERHRGFDRYLTSLGDFESQVAGLKGAFRLIGEFGAYYFLYVIGEKVPPHEERAASRGRKLPV